MRGRRKQRQLELKLSQVSLTLGKKLACFAVCVRYEGGGWEGEGERKGLPLFPLPLHFSEGLPLLPDKEVPLGSSFYNWREGHRIMRGRTLSWLQKLLVYSPCSSLPTAAGCKTETMGPRATKGREKGWVVWFGGPGVESSFGLSLTSTLTFRQQVHLNTASHPSCQMDIPVHLHTHTPFLP